MENKLTKTTKGRQKLDIKLIEKNNNLHVTYSKRRIGLFNKAAELGLLCGAQVAVLAASPSNKKLYSFGTPSVEAVVGRYSPLTLSTPLDTNHDLDGAGAGAGAGDNDDGRNLQNKEEEESRRKCLEAIKELEAEKAREKMIEEETSMLGFGVGGNNGGFWWDQPIDHLGVEGLKRYLDALEELKNNVMARADLLAKENSSLSPSNLLIIDAVVEQQPPSPTPDDQSSDYGYY